MNRIVYPTEGNGVAVVIPAPEFQDQIEVLAAMAVPQGKQWRIMDANALPPREVRDQWRWTSSGPLAVEQV